MKLFVATFIVALLFLALAGAMHFGTSEQSYNSMQPAFEWNKQLQWSKTYEGRHGNSIVQNDDGGFTITGAAESSD